MNPTDKKCIPIKSLDVKLEHEGFMRTLISELSGLLEDVVGLEEASGFISVVGQRIGIQIDQDYKTALGVTKLERAQIPQILEDLKRRIKGDFYVIEADETRIILGNRRCPFGDKVRDHTSLCMMTSNVFGVIAAENTGYAKVRLEQTIAQGDPGCRVVVYLEPSAQAKETDGREYLQTP